MGQHPDVRSAGLQPLLLRPQAARLGVREIAAAPHHLFVYGTLHPDRAPAEIAHAVRHLREVGPGSLRGTKYDLGDYPGVVIHADRSDQVHGMIFAMPADSSLLAVIDRYEDFRPSDPSASLFLRVSLPITQPGGTTLDCWVYLYNQPSRITPQQPTTSF